MALRRKKGTVVPDHHRHNSAPATNEEDGVGHQRVNSPNKRRDVTPDMDSTLVGRSSEVSKLENFLIENLRNKSSDSLYISGPPGTGKTACIRRAVAQLQSKSSIKHEYIYVNCMEIKSPARLFHFIYEKLCGMSSGGGKRKPLGLAKKLPEVLELELARLKGSMIVLVMDEIDQLETRNRDVLYSVFKWPTLPGSRVILVGIANSLDLTKRLLPKLNLKDAKAPDQMQFRAYNSSQVIEILKKKLSEDSFDSSAVELCARKVSSITGDIRKALDICRMSLDKTPNGKSPLDKKKRKLNEVEMEEGASPKVSCREVLQTVREVYGSKTERLSLSLPIQQKLILASALALSSSGKKQFPRTLLISAYKKACKAGRVVPLDSSECSNLCELLETQGLMSIGPSKGAQSSTIRLLVDEVSAKEVLNDEALVGSVMEAVLT